MEGFSDEKTYTSDLCLEQKHVSESSLEIRWGGDGI